MDGKQRLNAMLSSTLLDLEDQRQVAAGALRRAGFFPIDMKDKGARPGVDVISSSLEMVDEADAYVLLLGRRYGTPIPDARNPELLSTTHLELRRAVKRKLPVVVIMLSDAYLLPAHEEDDAARAKRDAFREEASALGIFETVSTPEEFGIAVADGAHHLHRKLLTVASVPDFAKSEPLEALFAPPRHGNLVLREQAVRALAEVRANSSLLIVTGLPGNGKSVLTEQLTHTLAEEASLKKPLWMVCERGDSLEGLLGRLSLGAGLKAHTTKAQCKELLDYLRAQHAMLVLEDFHLSEQDTMQPLLACAAALGPPAQLVLISRVVPDNTYELPGVAVKEVEKFGRAEIEALLTLRGIEGLSPRVVDELISKTGALPFAVGLFCGLVGQGRADARGLLAGNALWDTRLRKWFDDIESLLTMRARRLMNMLSLVEGPFEHSTVEMFASGASKEDLNNDLWSLQRMFLIERWGGDLWKMHDLVASLGRRTVPGPAVSAAYASLGRHYRMVAWDFERDGDLQSWFEYLVRACRAFERSGGHDDALQLALKYIAGEIKRRGAHFMFLELARNLIMDRRCSDPWLIYDFAHCCSVLGLYDEAAHIVQQALQTWARRDATLRLSLCRLQAEAYAASGRLRDGYEILATAIGAAENQSIRATNYDQAHSVFADIERRLGRTVDAHERITWLIEEAERRGSPVGRAVALCRKGHLMFDLGVNDQAIAAFEEARDVFEQIDNPRGEAWALVGLARTALRSGQQDLAADNLRAAAEIHEQIGGYDSDYETALQELSRGENPALQALVEAERARVGAVKLERRELARRLQRARTP